MPGEGRRWPRRHDGSELHEGGAFAGLPVRRTPGHPLENATRAACAPCPAGHVRPRPTATPRARPARTGDRTGAAAWRSSSAAGSRPSPPGPHGGTPAPARSQRHTGGRHAPAPGRWEPPRPQDHRKTAVASSLIAGVHGRPGSRPRIVAAIGRPRPAPRGCATQDDHPCIGAPAPGPTPTTQTAGSRSDHRPNGQSHRPTRCGHRPTARRPGTGHDRGRRRRGSPRHPAGRHAQPPDVPAAGGLPSPDRPRPATSCPDPARSTQGGHRLDDRSAPRPAAREGEPLGASWTVPAADRAGWSTVPDRPSPLPITCTRPWCTTDPPVAQPGTRGPPDAPGWSPPGRWSLDDRQAAAPRRLPGGSPTTVRTWRSRARPAAPTRPASTASGPDAPARNATAPAGGSCDARDASIWLARRRSRRRCRGRGRGVAVEAARPTPSAQAVAHPVDTPRPAADPIHPRPRHAAGHLDPVARAHRGR